VKPDIESVPCIDGGHRECELHDFSIVELLADLLIRIVKYTSIGFGDACEYVTPLQRSSFATAELA